jgi:hypothetical protein
MVGALSDGSNFYFGPTELRQVTDSFSINARASGDA